MKRLKPTEIMLNIIECCRSQMEVVTSAPGESIELCPDGHSRVVFLVQGGVDLYRIHDDLLISATKAPYTFGMMVNEVESTYYYLKPHKKAVLVSLDYGAFMQIVHEHDLWTDLMAVASHILSWFIHRDVNLVNKDRFNIVLAYLKELQALPEERRNELTATNYIVRRSGLSRSGVMGILSALKQGDYIQIENGVLLGMSDNIPKKF